MEFSKRFGDLDNIRLNGRKPRYAHYELFDAGNIDESHGGLLDPTSQCAHANRGNALWHVDSSFNPRRASFSLLPACELPPPGHGGNTEFADSRTAFEELPDDAKEQLLAHNYVGAHSLMHSRKLGSPQFFNDVDPTTAPMQRHEPSGRLNLYVGAHLHHIEGGEEIAGSWDLVQRLNQHVSQAKYTTAVQWEKRGDLVIWDNRCVLHRAGAGTFEGKYKRDLSRTTVHDDSPTAWGLNSTETLWSGPYIPLLDPVKA